jgi:hypothetical protein
VEHYFTSAGDCSKARGAAGHHIICGAEMQPGFNNYYPWKDKTVQAGLETIEVILRTFSCRIKEKAPEKFQVSSRAVFC